jgi:hypothetical protein
MKFVVLNPEIQEALEKAVKQFPTQSAFCKASGLSKNFCIQAREARIGYIRTTTLARLRKFTKIGPQKYLTRRDLFELGLDHPYRPKAQFRVIDGTLCKLCNGVKGKFHEPRYVPLRDFYPDRHKQAKKRLLVRAECKFCTNSASGSQPLVPFSQVYRSWLTEIVNRIGPMEASRRLGITQVTLYNLRNRHVQHLRQTTATAIISVLFDLRIQNEVRHRDSILHGAYLRGREEKIPHHRREFYKQHGDDEADARRRSRRRAISV